MIKKALDNLTSQEIKEMIARKRIKPEDLSISALNCLFEYESEAVCRGESDGALLCQCADILAQKEGFAETHDKSFAARLDDIMPSGSVELPRVRKPLRLKKALLVAVVTALLVCSASIVVAALGFDVFVCFKDLVFSPAGSKIEGNGITLIHRGESTFYPSIEDLIIAEQLDIMYPSKLPDGVSITEVRMMPREDGKETIEIKTTDKNVLIYIDLSIESTSDTFADCEKIEINNTNYYIHKEYLFAAACYNGNYYYIQANNYENILWIINHMEEYKP